MAPGNIAAVLDKLGILAPRSYMELLDHRERIPRDWRKEIYTRPEKLASLNRKLRNEGLFGAAWPPEYLGIGQDPEGNVYFIDTRESAPAVYLADHELLDPEAQLEEGEGVERLADSIAEWLHQLAREQAENDEKQPPQIFNRGKAEKARFYREASLDSLRALFAVRVQSYCALPETTRAGMPGPLSDVTSGLSEVFSYDLLSLVVTILLEQETACRFAAALDALAGTAESSRTRQVPEALERGWDEISRRVAAYGLEGDPAWKRLRRHYRYSTLAGKIAQ